MLAMSSGSIFHLMGYQALDSYASNAKACRWSREIPLPLDHFFFCFLPADAAAGACEECQSIRNLLLWDPLPFLRM